MKETAFAKLHKARWQGFEKTLNTGQPIPPDQLAEIFIELTDDLSFARTQYPDSRTAQYLNDLTAKIHLEIHKTRKEHRNRIVDFWKYDVPAVMYQSRKPLLYAFLIFIVSGLIGMVSTLYDDTFVRFILGDGYVNTTLENIKKGNPTAIYGNENAFDMFAWITLNNVYVAFRTFIFGVLSSIVTGLFIFYNGVMVGTFLTFFYTENQLAQAAPVVMLHGTIELSSLVVAGAAGLIMGNSILFPGTYSRFASFKIGAMKGLKIILGLLPFIVMAGFIESFITRYAFMHWSIKTAIISISALTMVFYFIIYPGIVQRHATRGNH